MTDQAPAEVMAKLAARFDDALGEPAEQVDEQAADETAGEEQQTEDLFELDIDGEKYQVPQKLKDAFMRTQDYTQKTQEIGNRTRSLEQAQALAETHRLEAAFMKDTRAEQDEISLIDAYLKQMSTTKWADLPADKLMAQHLELSQWKERRAALAQSIEGKRTKFVEGMQARLAELRGKAREIASKSINGFGEETEKIIRDYAKSKGFTDRELDNVLLDPRSVQMLWEGSQFAKVKAGTAAAKEKAEQAEKALRPGVAGRRMPPETASKLNFGKAMKAAKTSSQKASVIEARIAGMFTKGNR